MSSRRHFISIAALLSAAFVFDNTKGNAAPPMPNIHDDEERYWKGIRAQFPLSKNKIYLNNGTLGPSPYAVLDAVQQHMRIIDTQASHGNEDQKTTTALAAFLHVAAEEISLTHNVTEGINIVCWGLDLKAGDEVIISNQEHVGNASPWLNRMKLSGIIIKVISLGNTAEETLANIRKAIRPRTKVIALPHIPCTIGTLLPVKEICTLARSHGIYSLIDGAHPPGMLALDLKDIGCDFYASCCHKWLLGPKGTGFLYVAAHQRNALQAYYGGAGVDTGWSLLSNPPSFDGYAPNGHRYYYGTQNESLYVGIQKAIDFQQQIGQHNIQKRICTMAAYLQEQLIRLSPRIEMLTPTEGISRAAIISFRFCKYDTKALHSLGYTQHIITRYVAENDMNCLRISTHIYNSYAEVDAFLQLVETFLYQQRF